MTLISFVLAVAIPQFIHGRYIVGSICIGLGMCPLVYGVWAYWRNSLPTRKDDDSEEP